MDIARAPPTGFWPHALRQHVAGHPFTAVGLAVALLAVGVPLLQSVAQPAAGEANVFLRYALPGGAAGFAATALGALPALLLKSIPQKVEDVGIPLTTAIALQDIPEGLAVALALRAAGFAPLLAVALAAGAMLFVVSHEVIPETHRNGHQTAATLGLMGGFALMMVLDTTL